jgi:glucose-1-phosphate adenylyltransferase
MKNVLAVILGGGRGSRLYPLTKYRAKPAVPIAGKFRLIDIPISNCLHWDIRRIFVLTQFNTASLHRHISNTYKFDAFTEGFLQVLAAQQTMEDSNWYQGTADAVRKNLHYITNQKVDYIAILSGDQLYRINLKEFIDFHIEQKADITIAVKPVSREKARDFGILQMDERKRITRFVEKPKDETLLDNLFTPAHYLGNAEDHLNYIASMGIYIFNKEALIDVLKGNLSEDFGKQIIPDAINAKQVFAYIFHDYWEDIGTISSFFEANLDFGNPVPHFNFYDEERPIFTRKRFLPGSKIENCEIHYSLISDGAIIEGSKLTNTVVGNRSLIRANSYLERVVMMGADFYESEEERKINIEAQRSPLGVGYNCVIKNAILDKNARIGNHVWIVNEKKLDFFDADNYHIRDGIVVIPKNSFIPDGTVI